MRRQLLLIFIATTVLVSCNIFSNNIKENVDEGVNEAKAEMNIDISNAKTALTETCKKAMDNMKDSILINKITVLHSSINLTSKYIDNLTTEMEKLDNNNTDNVDLIKRTYLYNGIGDSLFNKVKTSYTLAIDIALHDTTKLRLTKVHDTFTEENKKLYFELNSPLGVSMVLYGIESELLKDGARCLYNYTNGKKSN